jgi:hypothetical protein
MGYAEYQRQSTRHLTPDEIAETCRRVRDVIARDDREAALQLSSCEIACVSEADGDTIRDWNREHYDAAQARRDARHRRLCRSGAL